MTKRPGYELCDIRVFFRPPGTNKRVFCGEFPAKGEAKLPSPAVYPGLYRHYKGDVYVVLATGTLDEHGHGNLDAPRIVTYHSTRSYKDGLANHRWEHEFSELVPWPEGGMKPRFMRVDP